MSDETGVTTKVDKIPIPQHVTYDPSTNGLSINVEPTCLPLDAIVECAADNLAIPTWQVIDTIQMDVTGVASSYKEALLEHMDTSRIYKGRSLAEDEPIGVSDEYNTRVRVKFCLREDLSLCSEYTEAESKYF